MSSLPRKSFLASLTLAFLSLNAVAGGFDPESLVGKDYVLARKTLLREGWTPLRHNDPHLMDWEKKMRRKYPELDGCAVDKPFCSLSFRRNGKCLRVITWGEDMKSFAVNAIAYDCLNDEMY